MTVELKACPHCGTHRIDIVNRGSWFDTHCLGCGARGPAASNSEVAAERWNWRRRAKRRTA